ncbi:alpha/beta fold hydrolase [Streptomyces sp. NPDC058319]|uniref:alpha/beta fold hydrolase n=1 Tax=unclassified Streptomyces TaxID=2593676 RepID=UPI0036E8B0AA
MAGGRARDAFHLVLPTLPGYGFSGNPARSGWNPARTARAFHELMRRLGHQEYVSQGGDWGSVVSQVLADQRHKGLLGMHVNMPGTVPKEIVRRLRTHDPAPGSLSATEKRAYDRLFRRTPHRLPDVAVDTRCGDGGSTAAVTAGPRHGRSTARQGPAAPVGEGGRARSVRRPRAPG